MSTWVYVAWFRSLVADPNDEDHEWVAVLSISAESAEKAKLWGDHLAEKRASRSDEDRFLWSEVHLPSDPMYEGANMEAPPLVLDGVEPGVSVLGW
jgi:hypothetical protein